MTEAEWNICTDPEAMLTFLQDSSKLSERKARLFAVACCRRIWHLLTDVRSRRAVEVAEQLADRMASSQQMWRAWAAAGWASVGDLPRLKLLVNHLSLMPVDLNLWLGAAEHTADKNIRASVYNVVRFLRGEEGNEEEANEQDALLRDIFGPLPFRPLPLLERPLMAWNGGLVHRLAEEAYEQRTMPAGILDPDRLAVLSDALEEAGADAALVTHLREPGSHWRGYWAVDAILGKT